MAKWRHSITRRQHESSGPQENKIKESGRSTESGPERVKDLFANSCFRHSDIGKSFHTVSKADTLLSRNDLLPNQLSSKDVHLHPETSHQVPTAQLAAQANGNNGFDIFTPTYTHQRLLRRSEVNSEDNCGFVTKASGSRTGSLNRLTASEKNQNYYLRLVVQYIM